MLVARLSVLGASCSRGLLNGSKPNTTIIRSFKSVRNPGRNTSSKLRQSGMGPQITQATKSPTGKTGTWEAGQIALGGGALMGLGALCYYGLNMSGEGGAIDRAVLWPQYVRDRIKDTYMYFGASCTLIGSSAVAVMRSPLGVKISSLWSRSPLMMCFGSMALCMATAESLRRIPYSDKSKKHLMWLVTCGTVGLVLGPIASCGGALAIRAGWYTAGIVGGLSLVAVCAPSDKFLTWSGPLAMSLGAMFAVTLGASALRPSMFSLTLFNLYLYGGILLFSAMLLYDTQKIIQKAERYPISWQHAPFDPINESLRIVFDVVNIHIRITQMLGLRKKGQ